MITWIKDLHSFNSFIVCFFFFFCFLSVEKAASPVFLFKTVWFSCDDAFWTGSPLKKMRQWDILVK